MQAKHSEYEFKEKELRQQLQSKDELVLHKIDEIKNVTSENTKL